MSLKNSAINPVISATVSASAGTGKTWLLVSRIIRLLLNDVPPETILAITFTRKAAAEMQTRLNQRLCELASCADKDLRQHLAIIDAPITPATRKKARQLYEQLLHSPQSVKLTTFHAFCQDVLKRFPFEADVPPGFELVEQTLDLEASAWDALINHATQTPNSDLAQALELLFEHCNGLANTQNAISNFLQQRSDWWAFVNLQRNPLEYACRQLKQQLDISDNKEPLSECFSLSNIALLDEFTALIAKHPTAANLKLIDLATLIHRHIKDANISAAFELFKGLFLTKEGKPRARKPSKVQKNKMGAVGESRFLELHSHFCESIQEINEELAKRLTFTLSVAWYEAGLHLLEQYQRIKTEQRLLDFTDLEWKCYQLLNETENAHWVQYKLDARINHILVDEFQDTNPTQWQLLLPLLQELTSAEHQNGRSVFIVGDTKQSIYRFRRAQPKLFDNAQQWLSTQLSATNTTLATSWRSAPAIMDFVNRVFAEGQLKHQIVSFDPHNTHHQQQWGRVEVLPLFEGNEFEGIEVEDDKRDDDQLDNKTTTLDALTSGAQATEPEPPPKPYNGFNNQPTTLRNPLSTPRLVEEDSRYTREADFIASKIQQLVNGNTFIGSADEPKQVSYDDIIILLRHRTHAYLYEAALMKAGIPFVGTDKGTLLDTLEVQDMVALLETLVAPYNNLALAAILHSPLFSLTYDDLMGIANLERGNWFERLKTHASAHPDHQLLQRANRLLSSWYDIAGKLPVHDLLDRIYSDSNLVNRYSAASPDHLKHRVTSNLTRFIELALEIDSGRYPSISRFLYHLNALKQHPQDAPDESPAIKKTARVRVMTIHAAKGLEAPVVFIADAANTTNNKSAYQAVVHWPASSKKPVHFFLAAKKSDRDNTTNHLLQDFAAEEARENANLLYVAITRAKQLLYISGCKPGRGKNLGWYGAILSQFDNTQVSGLESQLWIQHDKTIVVESGNAPLKQSAAALEIETEYVNIDIEPGLNKPFETQVVQRPITPSHLADADMNPFNQLSSGLIDTQPDSTESVHDISTDQRQRGIIIHALLQQLTRASGYIQTDEINLQQFHTDLSAQQLQHCLEEAQNVLQHHATRFLFDTQQFQQAYNEVPIHFEHNGQLVSGVIDRVVLTHEAVYVVDYKTQTDTDRQFQDELARRYKGQLNFYGIGAGKIWPDKVIQTKILFTANNRLVDIKTNALN